jgi:hypothetical protein
MLGALIFQVQELAKMFKIPGLYLSRRMRRGQEFRKHLANASVAAIGDGRRVVNRQPR